VDIRKSENDRRFQQLLEALSDQAICMLDQSGRVISWSEAAQRILGYHHDEIAGRHFQLFFTSEEQSVGRPDAILAQAQADGRVESEGWRIRKDGQRFWALASVHVIHAEDRTLIGYASVMRDISERHKAQQALIESERRFRFLVESIVDYAIFMLDVNGTIVNWNRGAERIKGYAVEEIVGQHFSIFYAVEDRQAGAPARALQQARQNGRYEAEGWRVRKNGDRFWASVVIDAIHDDNGQHVGYAKITRDVSERKAAQEALVQSERQFRLLVSGVVDYALFLLDPNGIVTNWNRGAERIKGYTAREIIGRHFSTFYTEADRAAGVPTTALTTAMEQGRYEAEGWRVRKDGSLFWASVVLDIIRDEDGLLVGFAKITRDITERRQAQMELQTVHERLAQAQKLEALGQLTGGVAHDFNNVLMVVSGQVQLLRMKLDAGPAVLTALDAIDKATKRGATLTRHLLAFARRQRLQAVPVSLDRQISSIRDLLSTSLPGNITLITEIPAGIWPVQVDPNELELALLNMAVNARDAMPSGGTLSITSLNVRLRSGDVDHDLIGEFVALTIRDTGAGIPPDILSHIFEPFFTTKDVDKGTGLGLSQVYGFARQSGGRVTVQSEVGQGTSFTLYLPRSYAESVSTPEQLGTDVTAPRGITILVVDDNPLVAEVVANLFQELGNTTRVVTDAEAALESLERSGLPDLVFSDIIMPGRMDGLALARRIREQYPEVPILLSTGYSRSVEQIGDEFPILRKPYQPSDLTNAVTQLIARHRTEDKNKVVRLQPPRHAVTNRSRES